MDPRLRDHRRYLAALTAAAAAEPRLNANQLAALARETAIAGAAADPAACRAASGDLFEYARGAWIDRLLGLARVAAVLDDPWTAHAHQLELDAALAARGHADWAAQLAAGGAEAAPWLGYGPTARAAASAIAGAAATLGWDRRPAARAEAVDVIAAQLERWSELQLLPGPGEIARWSRLWSRPRYALASPWVGEGHAAAISLVAAVVPRRPARAPIEVRSAAVTLGAMERAAASWRAGLVEARPAAAGADEPTVAELLAAYAPLATLPGDAPSLVALRAAGQALLDDGAGAETAQAALAVWVERGRLVELAAAPVRTEAQAVLERCQRWPDAIRAAGARALLADLSGIRTAGEVELVSAYHGACAAIEAAWSRAFAELALAPLSAACLAGYDPAAVGGAASAWTLARAVVGADASCLDWPLVAPVVAAMAAPEVEGAHLGELGHAIASDARAWFGVTGRAVASTGGARAALRDAWGHVPDAAPRTVRLWDRVVPVTSLGAMVPARPPLAGRSRPRDP